jgi:chromosome segregation ATPase
LEKANKAKDAVISQSEDKMAQLAEQLSRSEHKNRLSMEAQSKRIAELITELEREKSERGLAEGRLESVRKERTRLQLELSTLRARYMDDGSFNSSDDDDSDGLPRNSGNIKSFRPDPV